MQLPGRECGLRQGRQAESLSRHTSQTWQSGEDGSEDDNDRRRSSDELRLHKTESAFIATKAW